MSYPLIILGAGASCDYVHPDNISPNKKSSVWRPPLTNELFSPRFNGLINEFPELKNLTATVTADIRNGLNFEESLKNIQTKILSNKNRASELRALQFYLQKLFVLISDQYGHEPSNNYRALINEIKDKFGKVCIVNFNYDNLLEETLDGEINNHIDSYINGSIKIFKIHGGCDWVYPFDQYAELFNQISDPYKALIEDPEYPDRHHKNFENIPILKLGGQYQKGNGAGKKFNYYPAIAIPLLNKNEFVCPASHINLLRKELGKINKILIIGWKAGDYHLLELLKENIQPNLPLWIVVGGENGKQDMQSIRDKMKEYIAHQDAGEEVGGFSKFIRSAGCKTFFGTA